MREMWEEDGERERGRGQREERWWDGTEIIDGDVDVDRCVRKERDGVGGGVKVLERWAAGCVWGKRGELREIFCWGKGSKIFVLRGNVRVIKGEKWETIFSIF